MTWSNWLYDMEPKDNILVVAGHPDNNFSRENIIIAGAGGKIKMNEQIMDKFSYALETTTQSIDDFIEIIDGNKHRCSYCGGNTTDDQRGNCSACGAPRHENTESENGYFRLAF
jgi:rubrerythrin